MIEVLGQLWDSVLGIRLDGESLMVSPQELVPLLNELIETSDCDRCVIELYNLDSAAYYPFWEELSFEKVRTEQVRRCAIISAAWTQQWAEMMMTPLFKSAEIEWFSDAQLSKAWKWTTQGVPAETGIEEEMEMSGRI